MTYSLPKPVDLQARIVATEIAEIPKVQVRIARMKRNFREAFDHYKKQPAESDALARLTEAVDEFEQQFTELECQRSLVRRDFEKVKLDVLTDLERRQAEYVLNWWRCRICEIMNPTLATVREAQALLDEHEGLTDQEPAH